MEISDDELAACALASDPNAPIADDAVPFLPDGGDGDGGLLPDWYMPMPRSFERTPRRVVTAAVFIGALLVVNGAGLCVTYGLPEIAW